MQKVLKSSDSSLLVLPWLSAIIDGVCGTQVCLLVLRSAIEISGDLQVMLILENYRLRRKHTWKRCYSTLEENSLVVGISGPGLLSQACGVNQLVGHKNSKAPLGLGSTWDVLLP